MIKNIIINNRGKAPKKLELNFLMQNLFFIKKNISWRKRKGENYDNNNDEYHIFIYGNARRKHKLIVLIHLLKYINKQIKIKYNSKIRKGY